MSEASRRDAARLHIRKEAGGLAQLVPVKDGDHVSVVDWRQHALARRLALDILAPSGS